MIPDLIELGVQPLDQIMHDLNLTNVAMVEASTEQLTHKMVRKGREGRRLTHHVQMKILRALNTASQKNYKLKDLFNY